MFDNLTINVRYFFAYVNSQISFEQSQYNVFDILEYACHTYQDISAF